MYDWVRGCTASRVFLPGLIAAGLGTILALHFIEPELAITWSFAHLGRQPHRWWSGVALAVALPLIVRALWIHPFLQTPPRALAWPAVFALGAGLWVLLVWIGLGHPAPSMSVDTEFFANSARYPEKILVTRWYLTTWTFAHIASLRSATFPLLTIIRSMNALLATIALLALAGAALHLARTRGEAFAMTALAWTAFGTLQLAIGYLDVYPTALAFLALYLWSGLRSLQGTLHPLWPLTIAAIAPFAYIGLVLLGPSALVLMAHGLAQPAGRRRLVTALAVAFIAAGLATVPGFGAPFAWDSFVRAAAADSVAQKGLSTTSSLLPLTYMLSVTHAREVLHTMLLVDGVGLVLSVTAGAWVAARAPRDPAFVFLASVVFPCFVYLIAFDPIFGAFCDWDIFSYPAAATSLLGTYALVTWGRTWPRTCALLLGLALATSAVHLLARLNALHIEMGPHMSQSPFHGSPFTQ